MPRIPSIVALSAAVLLSAGAFAYYGHDGRLDAALGRGLLHEAAGAERELLAVINENPFDIEGWTKLGDFYQENGRLREALEAYETAIRHSDGDPDLALRTIPVLLRLERVDEAESRAQAVLARRPGSSETYKLLGWIRIRRATGESPGRPGPDAALLEEARRHFFEAFRIRPGDAEAFLGLAAAARFSDDDREALRLLQNALALDSESYWTWQNLGDVYASLRRDSEARAAYVQAARLAQGRPYSFMELAFMARRQERFAEAADYMRQVGAEGSYSRGVNLEAAGYDAGAESAYQEALLRDPEDEVALDRLETVRIRILPADDTGRLELAARRIHLGERAEAVRNSLLAFQHFRRAIQLAPQSSPIRLRMARFLSREKAYSEAIRQLQRVEELTRSQHERLVASDLMEVLTREALTEMETVHSVDFADVWDQPTSVLGSMIGNPEVLEARIRWSVMPVPQAMLRIAILPLGEPVRPFHLDAGRLASEWLRSALELLPGYRIVPASEIDRAMRARAAVDPEETDPGLIGAAVNADIVVQGRIIEEREKIRIEIAAIRVPAGPVVWKQVRTLQGPGALNRAVLDIAGEIAERVSLNGSVIRRQPAGRLTVNFGRIHGVREGDTIEVVRNDPEIFVRGLDWPRRKETVVAEGTVKSLTERYGEVLLTRGASEARSGDIVRRRPR